MTAAESPDSARAVAVGISGTGKTTLLRELWIERALRCIVLDASGEWGAQRPPAVGLGELLEQLEAVRRAKRWRVVAQLEPEEVEQLARLLVPPSNARAGLAAALGGVALAVDEVDVIAPQNAPAEIRALWQRGRHAGLSIFAATQSPALVHRIVTSQSRYLAVCQIEEPNELLYLRRALPRVAFEMVQQLPAFHAVLFNREQRRSYLLELQRRGPPRIVRELVDSSRAVLESARAARAAREGGKLS